MTTLHIRQDAPTDGVYPIRLTLKPTGRAEMEAEARIPFALSHQEQEDLRWYLEDYLQRAESVEAVTVQQIEATMKARGEELYRVVLAANGNTQALWFSIRNDLANLRVEVTTGVAEAAEAAYQRSLELFASNDALRRSNCIKQIGQVHHERFKDAVERKEPVETLLGHAQAAERGYLEALQLLPEDALKSLAPTHNQLGTLYTQIGQLDNARSHYEQAVQFQGTARGSTTRRRNPFQHGGDVSSGSKESTADVPSAHRTPPRTGLCRGCLTRFSTLPRSSRKARDLDQRPHRPHQQSSRGIALVSPGLISPAFRDYGNISGADASRPAALLVGHMRPTCPLLSPCNWALGTRIGHRKIGKQVLSQFPYGLSCRRLR